MSKPRGVAVTEEKLRLMVRRMDLSSTDAELWLGMLRQVAWKLGATELEESNPGSGKRHTES